MKLLKHYPFHPLLFSLYPVLSMLASNLDEIRASVAQRALLVAILSALFLWGIWRVLVKDWCRSALLATLFLLLFYSYGHVYHFLGETALFGIALGRHRLLAPVWLVIALVGSVWLLRKIKYTGESTLFLNVMGSALLMLVLGQMVAFSVKVWRAELTAPSGRIGDAELSLPKGRTPPDIYYIILDSYPRQDVLLNRFGYDNEPFLKELEELGFFVARCSLSNYSQTQLSLASSLNLNYLEALSERFSSGSSDRSMLGPLVRRSLTRRAFEDLGYRVVAFETGYYWTQLDDADYYLDGVHNLANKGTTLLPLNSFEVMLLRQTAMLVLFDSNVLFSRLSGLGMRDLEQGSREEHRQRVLYTFRKLADIAQSIRGPKFIFAHIVSPHLPIVFDAQGNAVSVPNKSEDSIYVPAYREQLTYLNQRILNLVQEVITASSPPPVIILQADHGYDRANDAERLQILNAYYLPEDGDEMRYPAITPVNTFRGIFNLYFGGKFGFLEDLGYLTVSDKFPYNYQEIPNHCAIEP